VSAETRNLGAEPATNAAPSLLSRVGRVGLVFLRVHVLVLSLIAGAILLYTLVGFLLVPRIARSQIEAFVTEELHKKIVLGELRFNPFAFDASVAGLMLTEPDGRPLLAFQHLYVNAELASLWRRAVVLKEVELSAPDIRVVVAKDGAVNLAELAPPSEPTSEPSASLPVHIDRLAVRAGRIGIEDHTHSKTFVAAIEPIRFTLTDFKTDAGYRNAYHFAGTTTSGEQLDWSGRFTVQPLGSSGQFSVSNLKAQTIDSYLRDSLTYRLVSGVAALRGSYQFALDPLALDVAMPSVAVRDLALSERVAGARPSIRVPELELEQLAFSYGKQTLEVHRISIRDAHADVAREVDGTISLQRLFGEASEASGQAQDAAATSAPTPAGTATEQAAPDSSSFSATAGTIQIDNAEILAEDRTVTPAARFELSPATLTVNGWSTDPRAKFQIDADVAINKAGKFATKGELQLEPLAGTLAIDLADIGLPAIQPYLAQTTAMTLHSGKLSAKGDVSFESTSGNVSALKFTGDARVADLRTTDQFVDEDFVKWRDLAVSGIEFQQEPARLSVDRIVARQPYARVIINQDTSLNVSHVLKSTETEGAPPDPETDEAPTPDQSQITSDKSLPASIRIVQVIDGSAHFADYSIQPSFATGIMELNGKVTGLSSKPETRAQVSLAGKVDRYAPVDITGEVNLLSAAKYTALAMNFRNMELTTFNPYSGKFAGYNISKGKLATELKYHVDDRKLKAEHHIVIDNLEFGAKTESKDAAPIPLKLAVALLKDRNGVIDVSLPVTGTLDDPKFRLGPIIWKAILGLLTKIVTAPFAALGALFGGGEELAFVDFPPGSATIAATETEKLDKLSKALADRPQLRLDVPITLADAEDAAAIAKSTLDAQIPPQAGELDDKAKRERLKQFERVYQTTLKSAPQYPPETETDEGVDVSARLAWIEAELLKNMHPDSARLEALARERAQAVQSALLANTAIDPQRLFITTDRKGAATPEGAIRMEMKLE
jgi:uncharacterized protein involved in outer membrane biogenesis